MKSINLQKIMNNTPMEFTFQCTVNMKELEKLKGDKYNGKKSSKI